MVAVKSSGLTPGMIQGIAAPNVVINPPLFYAATRRMRYAQVTAQAFAGFGSTDSVTLRQTGIVDTIIIRVTGTLTTAVADITTMTSQWPYNLLQRARLSANGQSNLMDCPGITYKCHQFTAIPKLNDRGVVRTVGAVAVNNGTLSKSSENWGTGAGFVLGPRHTPGGFPDTYAFDLEYRIPVSADPVSLIGSLFAQTTATNLNLDLQWATEAQVCTVGGSTTTWAINYSVSTIAYSIPQVNGSFVVPDVTTFHQMSEFRRGGLTGGDNEVLLPGTGPGRKLLRIFGCNVDTVGGIINTPLAMTDANFGNVAWRYGANDTPEIFGTGSMLRQQNEELTGCDIGAATHGRWILDFASDHVARDVVDQGLTSDLRTVVNLIAAPAAGAQLTCQETLFLAPAGA
jgi:hypothetical protein